MEINEIVNELIQAEETRKPISHLAKLYPNMTVDQAYQIQLGVIQYKLNKGHKIVGKKIGLTSKAMQELIGVDEPDYGHLMNNMIHPNGSQISVGKYILPRIEFEIALVLKTDLVGPNVTILDVMNAVDYVIPSFEIIDTRYTDWKIKLIDTVADNGSSAGAVLGQIPTKLEGLNLQTLGMVAYKNGEIIDTAAGAAVLGNPLNSVAWLANALSKYGVKLKAGEVILAGALSKAVDVVVGDTFRAEFDHLGCIEVSFTE